MNNSYAINDSLGYISFAASEQELNVIPDHPQQPHQENARDITHLDDAENFLYLLNTQNFDTKQQYIGRLAETNYDLFIIDRQPTLTPEDIEKLS